MLDIEYIRQHPEEVQQNCIDRNSAIDITAFLKVDADRREQIQVVDQLRAQRNEIAAQLQESKGADAGLVEKGKSLKEVLVAAEQVLADLTDLFQTQLLQIPNTTHPAVPKGQEESDNVELSRFLEPTVFDFTPKDHVAIGQDLGILDFERGADVAGRGFYYKKGGLAVLEMALIQFAMKKAMDAGFEPMITPDVARHEILQGTGYSPRGNETQIYTLEGTDLGLVATAEIPVAGYYRKHTFAKGELDTPKRIVALSHCFRTEDGAYGKESRGLYRVHQFAKVELFVFCKPEDAEAEHEAIRELEEAIMQELQIPYRLIDICTGDLGASAHRKYDIEAWMPFKQDYGEVTSASNCTTYQARRLQIQYITDDGKKDFVHTLNGTAAALSRLPIAVMENNQQPDGSIILPNALHEYSLGMRVIE